jgi:hypothetical protein
MIQTEIFMLQFTFSNRASVPDQDMKTFEWLHESIRNEYEHFIPKAYGARTQDLLDGAEICFRHSRFLLLESGNVSFTDVLHREAMDGQLAAVMKGVADRRSQAQAAQKSLNTPG